MDERWSAIVENKLENVDKKKELGKGIYFVAVWWLFVMTCGMLGELFPSIQPKYEIWEEEQLVHCFWDEKFYAYDIITNENGSTKILIEDGKGHSCFGYPDNGMMVVAGESLVYQEKFREIFEVLCDYYSKREKEIGVEYPDL